MGPVWVMCIRAASASDGSRMHVCCRNGSGMRGMERHGEASTRRDWPPCHTTDAQSNGQSQPRSPQRPQRWRSRRGAWSVGGVAGVRSVVSVGCNRRLSFVRAEKEKTRLARSVRHVERDNGTTGQIQARRQSKQGLSCRMQLLGWMALTDRVAIICLSHRVKRRNIRHDTPGTK